jgi:hypothetical protein
MDVPLINYKFVKINLEENPYDYKRLGEALTGFRVIS